MEVKIDNLTRQVERHNCLIERTYALEQDVAVVKAESKEPEDTAPLSPVFDAKWVKRRDADHAMIPAAKGGKR